MTPSRSDRDERFHAGRFILHVLQALTIAALIGVGTVLKDLDTAMMHLTVANATMTEQLAGVKDKLDTANLPKLQQDVVRLEDDQAYIERELNNYPPRDNPEWRRTHKGMD